MKRIIDYDSQFFAAYNYDSIVEQANKRVRGTVMYYHSLK